MDAPRIGNAEAEQTFKFDAESTESAAPSSRHSTHRVAVAISAVVVIIFVAALAGLWFLYR
jgi:hypothetical protein